MLKMYMGWVHGMKWLWVPLSLLVNHHITLLATLPVDTQIHFISVLAHISDKIQQDRKHSLTRNFK